MTKKEIREQEEYARWKKNGMERGFPESKLTFDRFKRCKFKIVATHSETVDYSVWDW